jgi:hypothetical protein
MRRQLEDTSHVELNHSHGATPFVIINNTTTEILGVKFRPNGATEPLEYGPPASSPASGASSR